MLARHGVENKAADQPGITFSQRFIDFFFDGSQEEREQQNRQLMLKLVASLWIKDLLDNSLQNAALLDLGLQVKPDTIVLPWEMMSRSLGGPKLSSLTGTSIVDVFHALNKSMLILGEPGSGKTTLLLELARNLINLAEQEAALPIPVVFNLASWQPVSPDKLLQSTSNCLELWLIDEFSSTYHIPKKVARDWLKTDQIVLLLDGLDEVAPEQRSVCVRAINDFRQAHPVPIAVCSRIADYEMLTARLNLSATIHLQPLSPQQVDAYMAETGPQLAMVRTALRENLILQAVAQSPLMLNIMILAYRGRSTVDLPGLQTAVARRQHLCDTYIQRIFEQWGASPEYSPQQTVSRLAWLAQQMLNHSQTLFFPKHMQPSWLANSPQRWVYALMSRLLPGLIAGIGLGLFLQLSFLNMGLITINIGYAALGGLLAGLVVGIVDGLRFEWPTYDAAIKLTPIYFRTTLNILAVGITTSLAVAPLAGLPGGALVGLVMGAVFGFRGSWQCLSYDLHTTGLLGWTWPIVVKGMGIALVCGMLIGSIAALAQGIMLGLTAGVITALISSLVVVLLGRLSQQAVEARAELLNYGLNQSFRNAIVAGLYFTIIGFLLFWMGQGFDKELLRAALRGFLAFGLLAAGWFGGLDIVQYCVLRLILWHENRAPLKYAAFLDYAAERIFLRKIGGGYIFVHRLLLEYFAELDE